MKNIEKFSRDINEVFIKICRDTSIEITNSLEQLKEKLIKMHSKGLVKINHSVMELIVAKRLLLKGYEVDVERQIAEN